MDKALSWITGRLDQSCRIVRRAFRGARMQITSALVLALLISAIAFAPAGNGQAVNVSASHQVIYHSGIVLSDNNMPVPTPTPTEFDVPGCLETPTPGAGEQPPCDPGGGGGGSSGDPHGG